jgi:hypothetical protein
MAEEEEEEVASEGAALGKFGFASSCMAPRFYNILHVPSSLSSQILEEELMSRRL